MHNVQCSTSILGYSWSFEEVVAVPTGRQGCQALMTTSNLHRSAGYRLPAAGAERQKKILGATVTCRSTH